MRFHRPPGGREGWYGGSNHGTVLAVKICPNPKCPHREQHPKPAEYQESVERCAECDALLIYYVAMHSPPRAQAPWRRAVVSLAALAVLIGLGQLPLPGITNDPWGGAAVPTLPSVGAVGLVPLLSAFGLIELLAVLVPALRRLRVGGYAGRARLLPWTLGLAMLLALLQATGIALSLQAAHLAADPGLLFILLTAVTLTGATAFAWFLTRVVDRHGLGNGFSVLLLGGLLPMLSDVGHLVLDAVRTQSGAPGDILMFLLVVASIPAATVIVLRGPRRSLEADTRPGRNLPLPSCGVDPTTLAASLMMLPATLATFGIHTGIVDGLTPTSPAYLTTYIAIGIALSLPLSWLYNQPSRVAEVWQRATIGDVDAARLQLRLAMVRSALFIAAVSLSALLANQLVRGALAVDLVGLMLATGVFVDLAREWRAHTEHADLTAVWPIHRVYAVGPAVDALAAAGIPVIARGAQHRALLQFFGAFVPVELLVPRRQAERAEALLRPLLTGSASDA